jgi:chlorite dismutase
MNEQTAPILIPKEGIHVLHLFYTIEYGQWQLFTNEEQIAAKTNLASLVQEIRATEQTQLLMFSIVSPKADLGFMLATPDLQDANAFEKRFTLALGADVLSPSFSYLSMTEQSEYVSSEDDFAGNILAEKSLRADSLEFATEMEGFRARMAQYRKDKLYPNLPNWPVFCFYPMSRRRGEAHNWYALPFAERKELMAHQARVGRQWQGRIIQLITGSTGLDSMEWGVTLFACDSFNIKALIYELRFDKAISDFAEFGDFYIGLQLPLDEIYRRLLL